MNQRKKTQLLSLTSDIAFKRYFKYDEELLIPLLQDFLPLPPGSVIKGVQVLDSEQNPLNSASQNSYHGYESVSRQ